MKLSILVAFVSIFNVAVAAAPSEPVLQSAEGQTSITSLTARTMLEDGYRSMEVTITAYSSTPDQTDDTPFITASNTKVRDGVIAANFLPFGTKVQFPDLYSDKVFTVEDRMNSRYNGQDIVDIWFATRAEAKTFGKRTATMVVLES